MCLGFCEGALVCLLCLPVRAVLAVMVFVERDEAREEICTTVLNKSWGVGVLSKGRAMEICSLLLWSTNFGGFALS